MAGKNFSSGDWYRRYKTVAVCCNQGKQFSYIVNLATKSILKRFDLAGEGYTCGSFTKQKRIVYLMLGIDKILIFDTSLQKFTKEIALEIIE